LMNTTYGYENNNFPLSTSNINTKQPSLKLYPNPVNTELTVTFKGKKQVSVYSIFGKKINSFTGNEKVIINTAYYANGIYFVKSDNEVVKFVVAH